MMMELVRRGRERDGMGSGYGDVRIIHVIGDCPPVIVLNGGMSLFLNPCSLLAIIAFPVAVSGILLLLHINQGIVD